MHCISLALVPTLSWRDPVDTETTTIAIETPSIYDGTYMYPHRQTTSLLERIHMEPCQTTVMNREETVNTLKCLPLGELT
jgi:hypothetical protein